MVELYDVKEETELIVPAQNNNLRTYIDLLRILNDICNDSKRNLPKITEILLENRVNEIIEEITEVNDGISDVFDNIVAIINKLEILDTEEKIQKQLKDSQDDIETVMNIQEQAMNEANNTVEGIQNLLMALSLEYIGR
jgi:hypothetical protein